MQHQDVWGNGCNGRLGSGHGVKRREDAWKRSTLLSEVGAARKRDSKNFIMLQSSRNYAQNPAKRGGLAKREIEQSRTKHIHKKSPIKRDEWKFAADRYKLSSVQQKIITPEKLLLRHGY
jgi:hypothetical protein